jgi:hypothetical protein
LIVRDVFVFFAGKTYYRAFRGVKKVKAPLKTLRNVPLYVLPQTKKIISRTFKIRGTLVFLYPKRERERERNSEKKSKSKCKSKSKSERGKGKKKRQGKGQGKGKRESTKALAILFLNRLGQSEKSANYTVLYRKEQYSMYS